MEDQSAGPSPRVEAFGNAAVLITLAGEPTVELAARAQALARRIRADDPSHRRWRGVVPAAASVLVHVRTGERPPDAGLPVTAALERLEALARESHPDDDRWPPDAPSIQVPVRYGGDAGPDLRAVADATGLSPEQVVEAHVSVAYRALFLGFAPGFAYLGPLPSELVLPRRATPRVRVPAGSVAIAGPYTAIYPLESPGGWHLLGRTSTEIWQPARDRPAAIDAGSLVRFVPERS